jgi:5-(carboxyamino)imidazole ribonucleotide synthase
MNRLRDGWIGVLGGGQLGRMLSFEARRMGYKVLAWTGGDRSGAANTADKLIEQPFDDPEALKEFTTSVSVATVEFENLPKSMLESVEERIPLYPSSEAVSICQHREREKTFLSSNGFGCANFRLANDIVSFRRGISELKTDVIVKTAEFGYDGKGQKKVPIGTSEENIGKIWKTFEGGRVVIEECIPLKAELSVLVARKKNGDFIVYDPIENIHRNHILDISIVPARIDGHFSKKATEIAIEIAKALNYIGLLAVEFFISSDGRLVVNEIAPRPHNSGHHTINACACSQFENQARAINDIPLGSPELLRPVAMMNLLGDLWKEMSTPPNWNAITSVGGASLHLYGKKDAREGRKMGHATFIGDSQSEIIRNVNSLRETFLLPKIF